MDFYILLEKLIKELNGMTVTDPGHISEMIKDLAAMFGLARVEAWFFSNARMEELGQGRCIVAYDSGEEGGELVTERRIVTPILSIVTCNIFKKKNAPPISEGDKERIGMVFELVSSYITRIRLRDVVDRLTYYDDDGYHNLRYFFRYIESYWENHTLFQKAAIHFNLKHFTLVNQQVGRAAGNIVIRGFYEGLKELIGGTGTVCRMGGDNFVAICDKELVEKVVDYLSGTAVIFDVNTGERIMVSAYAGILMINEDFPYHSPGDIMDRINAASMSARSSGKSDVVYFDANMAASKEKVARLHKLFEIGLKEEEYRVFYQPKFDINTGELMGAEALCRWFRDGKIIPPMEFIPILEQDTSICKLDFYMLDHVCRDIRRWLDEGRKVVRISVNLSRKHMMNMDLLEHIINIVDRNNVPHQYIEIELTETTTDVEFKDLKRVVGGLQNVGIYTSVDDFGMGYSSLNLIKEIPWNVLKVDRSFLPLDDDKEGSTRSVMFKYVVAMAREMGLQCIAEGVETEAQVEVLRNNRCDVAQGFFFDKPLPVEEFENRMK